MAYDLRGKKSGKLEAVSPTTLRIEHMVVWECVCACGRHRQVSSTKFARKQITGCLACDPTKAKHGHKTSTHESRTYTSWKRMLTRCYNPKSDCYKSYGAKGVLVCTRWRDFRSFLEDMGPRPEGKTLGRILDMGNYEPGNAFWMSSAEQGLAQRNKRALLKWQSMREASFRKPPTGVGFERIAVA